MSYVKYREDDIKIINDRLFMRRGGLLEKPRQVVRYYECKYCHQIFTSKSKLNAHIREIHNVVRPLIIINGKVIGTHTVLQYVNEAKILMYGFTGDIQIGGKSLRYNDTDEIDITDILQTELTVKTSCDLVVNGASLSIEFHPLSLDGNSLMREVIDDWQYSASHGLCIDGTRLADFSGGDLLFLQGIFNYYLACTSKHHKASRYDDAYAALSQFHDLPGLGRCVLKAIAFRRNWLDMLRYLSNGEDDIFATACDYYNGDSSSFDYEADKSSYDLFIEDGTKLSLDLITLYQKGLYSEAKTKLKDLGDIDDLDDLNLMEQLYLLKARIAVAEGNRSLATRCYDRLITPAFREERLQFI